VSVERRALLQMLAATVASCGLGAAANSAACGAPFVEGIDWQAVRELGQEYLRTHAKDAELESITAMIDGTRSDWQPVIDELRTLMRADYEAGRLVNLSGWFVSKTEARLLAGFSACRKS
jgi:hypothetical protein